LSLWHVLYLGFNQKKPVNTMKKLFALLLTLGFAFSMFACGGGEKDATETAEDAVETVEETVEEAADEAEESWDDATEGDDSEEEGEEDEE